MGDSDQYNNQTSDSVDNPDAKPKKAQKADRSAQAKAFYRAMYAGAEPDPEDFGMQAPKEDAPTQNAGSSGSGPCALCQRMQSDMEDLERKTQEAENLYKRMAADFENYRKRVSREREEFSAAGVQRAVEAILPALDDLDMAKSKLSPDMDPAAMMESLNLVYNRFNRCLEQIGIKQLAVIGTMFDPKYHEPVQQVYTTEVPDGAIVHQLRPGYMFNDKVLRPSLVNVATAHGGDDEGEQHYPEAAAEEEVQYEQESSEESDQSEEQYNQEEQGEAQEYAASDDHAETGEEMEMQPDEEHVGSMTQDLPAVDVASELLAKEFEEEEQASASE